VHFGWEGVFSSRETQNSPARVTAARPGDRRERRESQAGRQSLAIAGPLALLQGVFSVVFPSDCKLCSAPLLNISRLPVCPECLHAIAPLRAPQCVLCGDRLQSAQLLRGDGQCANCHELPPDFDRAVSFGEYQDQLRGLIHLLKYEGITSARAPLGAMLAETISELLPKKGMPQVDSSSRLACAQEPLLVAVPLHRNRRRTRGFNQAELIARTALKQFGRELEFASGVLIRKRETISQVGLSREERIENMRGAFRVVDAARVRGRNVVVVDDVMTTGTTLSECARMLKKAGADKVWAATVARAFHGAELAKAADTGVEEEAEAGLSPTNAEAALVADAAPVSS
jgi:ComF family protein